MQSSDQEDLIVVKFKVSARITFYVISKILYSKYYLHSTIQFLHLLKICIQLLQLVCAQLNFMERKDSIFLEFLLQERNFKLFFFWPFWFFLNWPGSLSSILIWSSNKQCSNFRYVRFSFFLFWFLFFLNSQFFW